MNANAMNMDNGAWISRMKSPRDDMREAASQLVSDALVVPALSMLHESRLRPSNGPFAESNLEKRFAPLLEAQLADCVTKAANFQLVDAIVDRFERLSSSKPARDNA